MVLLLLIAGCAMERVKRDLEIKGMGDRERDQV